MKGVTTFTVKAMWLGGGLTPAQIGQRFLSTLRQLDPLSPAMDNWLVADRDALKYVPLSDARPLMNSLVERNVQSSDFEGPDPELGYYLGAKGSAVPSEFGTSDSINLYVHAGAKLRNDLEFSVGDLVCPPDLRLVTYPVYKGALEALAANWPCPWAFAYAYMPDDEPAGRWVNGVYFETEEDRYAKARAPFEVAWIVYLSAPLAAGLTPPSEILGEPTPGGGMILSAVQERLDPSNPEHMRRSRVLEAIMDERVGRVGLYLSQTAELPARVGPY